MAPCSFLPIKRHPGLDDPSWIIVDDRRRVGNMRRKSASYLAIPPTYGSFFLSDGD
jgi:hypothetical protein